ncbi:MAG: serine acetyltransferase, partial [Rubrivivax sp.]
MDKRSAPPTDAAQVDWNLNPVVAGLRKSREVTHNIRHKGRIRELPARETLVEILQGLLAVLFPT